jgi:nucleotide-binding universal stress UspA family protein
MAMKTIVVGYDGSEASELALERVVELARALKAKVIVTSVETPVATEAALAGGGSLLPVPVVDTELQQRKHAERERLLVRARGYFEKHGIPAEVAAPFGPPIDEIIEVADQNGADLIVVGTDEPGLLERLFRGGVSQGVARKAHCDVLIVHPVGKKAQGTDR